MSTFAVHFKTESISRFLKNMIWIKPMNDWWIANVLTLSHLFWSNAHKKMYSGNVFPRPVLDFSCEVEPRYIFKLVNMVQKWVKILIWYVPEIKIDNIVIQKLITIETTQVIVIDYFSFWADSRVNKRRSPSRFWKFKLWYFGRPDFSRGVFKSIRWRTSRTLWRYNICSTSPIDFIPRTSS